VIHDINPLPLRIIFPSTLPILRMDEVNTPVFIGLSSSFAPIEILIPLHLGLFQTVELTHPGHCPTKVESAIILKET